MVIDAYLPGNIDKIMSDDLDNPGLWTIDKINDIIIRIKKVIMLGVNGQYILFNHDMKTILSIDGNSS